MQVGDQKRRDAVVNALTAILDEAAVEQAITVYDVEFADQQTLSVAGLVGRLDSVLSLGPKRKLVYKQLTTAVQGGGGSAAEASTPQAAEAASGGVSDAGTVFGFLVREIVSRCKHRDASSVQGLSRHVASMIPQLQLSAAAEQDVRAWVRDPEKTALGSQGTDEEMKRVFQGIYMWSCDWFGPVDTDRMFAEGVRNAEQLPAAGSYSPRKFL